MQNNFEFENWEAPDIAAALVVGVISDAGPHLGFDLVTKDVINSVHSEVSLDGIIDPQYCVLVTRLTLTEAVVTIAVRGTGVCCSVDIRSGH